MRRDLQSFRASDGVTLRYVVDQYTPPWEKPATVVLLHAAMGSHERMRAWVPHLAGRFRVARWDMRGHGASDKPGPAPEALTIERLSRDLVELIDHLGEERVHVAGSSAGGIVAMYTAITRPERIATLAAYAATPGLRMTVGHTDYEDWIRGLQSEGVYAMLKRTIRQRFTPDTDPRFIEWFLQLSAENDPTFLARYVRMMTQVDFADRVRELRCPCLFVVPGSDPNGTEAHYGSLRAASDHELRVYDGLAHNITDAVPDRCARDLAEFLVRRGAMPRAR